MSLHGYFLCQNPVEVHGGFYQQANNNCLTTRVRDKEHHKKVESAA